MLFHILMLQYLLVVISQMLSFKREYREYTYLYVSVILELPCDCVDCLLEL